jgi:hypothetical protein
MLPPSDADRQSLSRMRAYLRRALEAAPANYRWRSILASVVASVTSDIGPEDEGTGEAPPADGWHGEGGGRAEVQAAIRRIANDPGLPGWDGHEREC